MNAAFDDRVLSMDGPEQLATVAAVLGSRTRLAVLRALVASAEPLHINELARRVGVDASPVRTHLELLVKAGLAREVGAPVGRERRFHTTLTNVRLVLEGADRPSAPERRVGPPPKEVQRLEKKRAALDKDLAKLAAKARKLDEEIQAAWRAKRKDEATQPAPPR